MREENTNGQVTREEFVKEETIQKVGSQKEFVRQELSQKQKLYTRDQLMEIKKGREAGISTKIYENPAFLSIQMMQIRLGLEAGLPAEKYAFPDFDWMQMEEIRKGLEQGVDLSGYRYYSAGVLYRLREAYAEGVDLSGYLEKGYDLEQLREIQSALKQQLPIDRWIDTSLRGAFIKEIVLGLKRQLDISLYVNKSMNWQQMREIRLGLEHRVDVAQYQNVLYSPEQMREIRLGLEESLPVEDYKSFMYTAKEMSRRRKALLTEREQLSKEHLFAAGKKNAQGAQAAESGADGFGADGYYEFFFDLGKEENLSLKQVKREDASLTQVKEEFSLVQVKKGEKLAYYHPATVGKNRKDAKGNVLPGIKGKEKKPLEGTGFFLLEDGKTYVAAIDGVVKLQDDRLLVAELLTLDEGTKAQGKVFFDGFVHVLGNVKEGAEICATKDIVVDGFTEDAILDAKGNIFLKKGSNAGKHPRGFLRAGGDVIGQFFENTSVTARESIKAGYCLGCNLYAGKSIEMDATTGKIIGGNAVAGDLIASYDIGNESGAVTNVGVGRKAQYQEEQKRLKDEFDKVKSELTLLKNAYRDFTKKFDMETRNTHPVFLKLEDAIYTKTLEEGKLKQKQNDLKKEEAKARGACVTVKGTLYQGVSVSVNEATVHPYQSRGVTLKQSGSQIVVYRNE